MIYLLFANGCEDGGEGGYTDLFGAYPSLSLARAMRDQICDDNPFRSEPWWHIVSVEESLDHSQCDRTLIETGYVTSEKISVRQEYNVPLPDSYTVAR